jgi:hypothetical protein
MERSFRYYTNLGEQFYHVLVLFWSKIGTAYHLLEGSEEHSPFAVEIGDLLRVFLLEPARSCYYPSLLSTIRSASRGTHFFIFSLL